MSPSASREAVPGAASSQAGASTERPGYFVMGAGTPIVMLHSSLSSKMQWTALAERLVRFRVIAIDLCGYGDNAMPASRASFAVDDEVRLVMSRVDRLLPASTPIHIVGHSYGALVALRYAQWRRDRVASLSLYEPVAFRLLADDDPALGEARKLAARVASLVALGHRHEAAQLFVDFWSGEGSYASMPLPAQASLARRVDKVPLDFAAAMSWPIVARDLRAIVAPVLLLAGERSPAVARRIHARLTHLLPNYRVGTFDCGHMGPVTDPHRINPWIEAFVDACAERDTAAGRSHVMHWPA